MKPISFKLAVFILALLTLAGAFSVSANEVSGANRVFSLINERLGHMQSVAYYKMRERLPIEDNARETVVINKAVASAQQLGFETRSIAQFYRTQIQVAKAIQHRVVADAMHESDKLTFPDLLTQIRPELIRLSEAINQALAHYLEEQVFIEEQRLDFNQALNNSYLTTRDKEVLFNALIAIKKSPR
jgi:chorismate mutase